MIKAIFFDLDDLLYDALNCHQNANRLVFSNLEFNFKKIKKNVSQHDFMGMRVIEVLDIMKKSVDLTEKNFPLKKLAKLREDIFLGCIIKEAKLLPGAKQALKIAQENFEFVSIVSSGTKKYINIFLKNYKLNKYVDLIVTGDDVKKGKPYPDCYLKAFKKLPKKLNIKKSECLVVEDAANGLIAAKKARMKVLFVPSKNYKLDIKPDWQLKSLKEFDKNLLNQLKN